MNTDHNLLLTILLPPMAVARKNNSNLRDRQVQLACLLTLCCWIPGKNRVVLPETYSNFLFLLGIIYSLSVCYGRDADGVKVAISQPQPLHTVPKFLFSYPTSPTTIIVISAAETSPVNPFLATDVIV
jgi:uncharacterized membrane protein YqaE (UPF0057 family)